MIKIISETAIKRHVNSFKGDISKKHILSYIYIDDLYNGKKVQKVINNFSYLLYLYIFKELSNYSFLLSNDLPSTY